MQSADGSTAAQQRQYGTTAPPATAALGALSAVKKRMNWVAPLVAILVPWLTFTIVFGLLSFSMRYRHAGVAWYIVTLLGIMTATCGLAAYRAYRKKQAADPSREPTWYIFVFLSLVVAWLMGVILGSMNYAIYMKPYYEITNLNTYPGVDPARHTGQQVMDAGRVTFAKGSYLDLSKSMGFKNGDTYCVAPVVLKDSEAVSNYDFWAVGENCCSSDKADFHCGKDYNSPTAHAGLRLMTEDTEYYKLAVEQARVAHKINSKHPLFFTWTEDVIGDVNANQEAGVKLYIMGVLTFLAFSVFTVIMASAGFSKLP